jgi:hypothetical protein
MCHIKIGVQLQQSFSLLTLQDVEYHFQPGRPTVFQLLFVCQAALTNNVPIEMVSSVKRGVSGQAGAARFGNVIVSAFNRFELLTL